MKKAKVNANNLVSIFPSFLSSLSQVDFSKQVYSSELSHKPSLHAGYVTTTLTYPSAAPSSPQRICLTPNLTSSCSKMADKNQNKIHWSIFPTKKLIFLRKGAWKLSTFDCFTGVLGPGRSLVLQAAGLGHSPRIYVLPLSHPLQVRIFIVFSIQADINPWASGGGRRGGILPENSWFWDALGASLTILSCSGWRHSQARPKLQKAWWAHPAVCCAVPTYQSRAWQHSKGTGSERGWERSRGSDGIINHPFAAGPGVNNPQLPENHTAQAAAEQSAKQMPGMARGEAKPSATTPS